VLKKKNKIKKSNKTTYVFKAKLWKYHGPNGWYFLTVPKGLSSIIRKSHFLSEEGWGRLKTISRVGGTKWMTSIWYDSKIGAYILPIKSEVRKKEDIKLDHPTSCTLEFEQKCMLPFLG